MAKPTNPAEENLSKQSSMATEHPAPNAISHRAEANHLRSRVGLIDLSNRDRLGLLGEDRQRFLNGQVTNNIRDLRPGSGCYSLIVNNKGTIQGDGTIFCLEDEILLDIEPNQGKQLAERLNGYIVSDDVEIVDVAPHFDLISIQGPFAHHVLEQAPFIEAPLLPTDRYAIAKVSREDEPEVYAANHPRTGSIGYDLFIATDRIKEIKAALAGLVAQHGGAFCGAESLETLRVEAGIPQFPIDMAPSILAPELRQEDRSISYKKGCYIGQEVINRIKSIGKVKRELVGLIFDTSTEIQSLSGSPLYSQELQKVGFVTSVTFSEPFEKTIGLAIVKTAASTPGNKLFAGGDRLKEPMEATLTTLPFELPNQSE